MESEPFAMWYDGAVGIKTRIYRQAGNCVVGALKGYILIAVSLNSPTVYEDLMAMLDMVC